MSVRWGWGVGSVPAMASAIALCTRRMHARTCTHTHTRSTHTRIHARATRAHTHTARPLRPAVALPLLRLTRRGGWAGADAMQALGAGEYFAENPQISIPYCAGGKRMLVFAVLMVPQAARLGTHSARDQPEISPRSALERKLNPRPFPLPTLPHSTPPRLMWCPACNRGLAGLERPHQAPERHRRRQPHVAPAAHVRCHI